MKKIFKKYEETHQIKPFDETFKNIELINDQDYIKESKKENRRKGYKVGLGVLAASLAVIMLIPVCTILVMGFSMKDHMSYNKKQLSFQEKQEYQTVKIEKLNDVKYPEIKREYINIKKRHVEDVNNFTHQIYLQSDKQSFAPLNLYSHLHILSGIASESKQDLFNQVLGSNEAMRYQGYIDSYRNNYYYNAETQEESYQYNGLFFDEDALIDEGVKNHLTEEYVEIYSLDFNNQDHLNQMASWVNAHNEATSYEAKDFNVNQDTFMYLFSSYNFDNKWRAPYDSKDNFFHPFLNLDGSEKNQEFINHKYLGDIYDYGTYISVYDYYNFGNTIQYITPKNRKNNIFELIGERNFLIEGDKNKSEYSAIDLSVPKFELTNQVNIKALLSNTPLSSIYDSESRVFNESFRLANPSKNIYLESTEQHNKVKFNEEGTKVSSLTFSMGASSAMPNPDGGYQVILDSSFIFVIRDNQNIPLFLGQVTKL